jgi:ribosomal protein S8
MYRLIFLINSLKVGLAANKKFIYFPSNKFVLKILKFFFYKGYIQKIVFLKDKKILKIFLKYSKFNYSSIEYLHILSKINLHIYISYFELSKTNKIGMFLLSTPYGVLADYECLKLGIGGKLLLYIK